MRRPVLRDYLLSWIGSHFRNILDNCFLLVDNKDYVSEEYLKNVFEYVRGTGGFE